VAVAGLLIIENAPDIGRGKIESSLGMALPLERDLLCRTPEKSCRF
jgi:hypothetical protein